MKYFFWIFGGIILLWLTSGLSNKGQGELVVEFGPVIDLPDPNWREPIFLTKGKGSLRATLIKRLSPPESVIRVIFQKTFSEILLLGEHSAIRCNVSNASYNRLPIPAGAKPIGADPNGQLLLIQNENLLTKVDTSLQKIWDFKVDKYSQVALLSNDRTLVWAPFDRTIAMLNPAGVESGRISYMPGIDNGIVGDKLGAIWVSDSALHLVSRLSEDGGLSNVLSEGLEINTDPNELFAYPSHLMVDAENRLWVENYLEREGDSVTIINPTRDRFLRFSSKEFLPELDHENEEYSVHVSPFDNTLLVTNVREPEMFLYSYELELEGAQGSESDEQPTPDMSSAGIPKHVEGYYYPSKFPIVPFLGLALWTLALFILRRRRKKGR